MRAFLATLFWTGLLTSFVKSSELEEKSKRFILVFSSSTCQDAIDNCNAYPSTTCTDPTYVAWAKDNCKKTCNFCSDSGNGGGVPTIATCNDKLTDCASYGPSACTGQYAQWAKDNCAKTCNLCSSNKGAPSMGGNVAPAPVSGNGGDGSFQGSSSGCYYNSQLYQQDQTWNDGCKYKCRCVDGTSGKYECRQLCLNWDLPPSCQMIPPAPGKCCPKPSCPSNIVLQYPDGYVEE